MKYIIYLILSVSIVGLLYASELRYVLYLLHPIFVLMILIMGFLVLKRGIRKSFSIVVTFPLFLIAISGFVSLYQVYPLPRYDEVGSGFLLLVFFAGTLGMICAIAVKCIRPDREGESFPSIMLALGMLTHISMSVIVPFVVLLAPIPATLATMLTSALPREYQRRILVVLGLWSVIMVGGWVYAATLDDGLDTFIGQERVAAEEALQKSRCNDIGIGMYPGMVRVVKDDSGVFRVLGYTWWRLPTNSPSCGPYVRGNRW